MREKPSDELPFTRGEPNCMPTNFHSLGGAELHAHEHPLRALHHSGVGAYESERRARSQVALMTHLPLYLDGYLIYCTGTFHPAALHWGLYSHSSFFPSSTECPYPSIHLWAEWCFVVQPRVNEWTVWQAFPTGESDVQCLLLYQLTYKPTTASGKVCIITRSLSHCPHLAS